MIISYYEDISVLSLCIQPSIALIIIRVESLIFFTRILINLSDKFISQLQLPGKFVRIGNGEGGYLFRNNRLFDSLFGSLYKLPLLTAFNRNFSPRVHTKGLKYSRPEPTR